jgi:hypothetical protein
VGGGGREYRLGKKRLVRETQMGTLKREII